MTDTKKMTLEWGHAVGLLAGAVLALGACASHGPPPHIVEVPIAEFSASPGPTPAVADASAQQATTSSTDTTATDPSSASGKGHGGPTPLPGSDAPGPGGRGRPSGGQRISARECKSLADKCAILTGVGQGMTMPGAIRALGKLRSQADASCSGYGDPCVDNVSRTQFQCGLTATSLDALKACMQ
jgi:hypothetical protein